MDFNRWHRKTERKASVRVWRGAAVALVALMVSGVLAAIDQRAGSFLRPIIEVLAWLPFGLFVIGFAVAAGGALRLWRLYSTPYSVYQER